MNQEEALLRARKIAHELDASQWTYLTDILGQRLLVEGLEPAPPGVLPFRARRVFLVQMAQQPNGQHVPVVTPLPLLSVPETSVQIAAPVMMVTFSDLATFDREQFCLLVGQAVVQNEMVQERLRAANSPIILPDAGMPLPGGKGFIGANSRPR